MRRRAWAMDASRGFTLLELLVALAVFALLSAMGYAGLQTLMNSQSIQERHDQELAQLTRALALLQQDLEQAVARPVRDAQGDEVPPLQALDDGVNLIEFTRAGWFNPSRFEAPMLQRVGYRLEDSRLIRRTWPVLDQAPDTAPTDTVLLEHVERLQLRLLDAEGSWLNVWPPAGTPLGMPIAVDLRLELGPWGEIRRLFRMTGP